MTSDAQGGFGEESYSGRSAKRKPPNQRVRRPSFPLLCWWLCLTAMPKQYQAVLGGTKTRAQKPVTVIPTLSRSYAEVSFQLTSVWSSASTVLPPNPAACLRIGVWGKPWDKYANYFETASPQFHFCPGDKNGLVLRPRNVPSPIRQLVGTAKFPAPD